MSLWRYISALILLAVLATPAFVGAQTNGGSKADMPDGAASPDRPDITETKKDANDEEAKVFSFKAQFKELFTYTDTIERSFAVNTYIDESTGEVGYSVKEKARNKSLFANLMRLRLSPEIKGGERFLLHVDLDNEIISSDYMKSREFDQYWRPSDYNDFADLSCEPVYDDMSYYRMKLHRAYAKILLDKFTATIGRQQIRFGSGRLWNPLDILNPISPTYVEGPEDQKGTDALRLEYYPFDKTELGLIIDPKRMDNDEDIGKLNSDNTNVLARFKTSLYETEIALMGGRVSHRLVGGADASTHLLDGLLRGSVLYAKPDPGREYAQASAGYEYNFSFGLYFLIEYFYNENGMNYNSNLANAYERFVMEGMSEAIYRKLANQLLTWNQHYGGIALGYDITPLVRGELFSIYDFQGKGLYAAPSLKYNIVQNADLAIGVMKAYRMGISRTPTDFESLINHPYFYFSLVAYF